MQGVQQKGVDAEDAANERESERRGQLEHG